MQKREEKVKLRILVILLIPYYKAFHGNSSISSTNLGSLFFALNCFDYFSLNWAFCKPSLNSATINGNNNGNKYFTAEYFYSAPLFIVHIKLFTGPARISQKRFVSLEVHLSDGSSFSISLCLFYFLFKFFIISNL